MRNRTRALLDGFLSSKQEGLEAFFDALLQLQRLTLEAQPFQDEQIQPFLELYAKHFKVSRVSHWYLKSDSRGRYLQCSSLYETDHNHFCSGLELFEREYPDYFQFLDKNVAFAANDVYTHPYTRAFEHSYLRPLNIMSMIDAPIHVLGQVVGVICVEQVGSQRNWNETEEGALIHMTSQIAGLLITQELDRRVHEKTEHLQKSEAEVRHLAARLVAEAKMSALGEMAGSIAHEIKNPMTVILGRAVHLKEKIEKADVPKKEILYSLGLIEKTSDQILGIVEAMKTYTRDGSRDPLSPVLIHNIIEDSLQMMSTRLEHNSFSVTKKYKEDLLVQARPTQILQILVNLFANAIEANEERSRRWLRIEASSAPPYVEIKITDSGEGISKKVQERMFLPLYTTKSSTQSTGLGLSIARGIAQEHMGELLYDDTVKNTTFILKLLAAQ